MFCKNCGKEIPDGAQFCSWCGTSLSETINVNPSMQQQETWQQDVQQNAAYGQNVSGSSFDTSQEALDWSTVPPHEYHEIGGFLAFIIYGGYIGLAILAVYVLVVVKQIHDAFSWYGVSMGSVSFMLFGLVVASAALIFGQLHFLMKLQNRESGFLWYYHKYTIVLMIGLFLIKISQGSFAIIGGGGIGDAIGEVIGLAIGAFLYTLYFRKSVRIRTYMRSAAYLRESYFTNGSPSPVPADGTPAEYFPPEVRQTEEQTKKDNFRLIIVAAGLGIFLISVLAFISSFNSLYY